MRIERFLTNEGQAIRFQVVEHPLGWRVVEEESSVVTHDVVRDDWHRVERDLSIFELKAIELRQLGWVDQHQESQPRAA